MDAPYLDIVFATKDMKEEALPQQGRSGWKQGQDAKVLEVVFVDGDWIPVEIHRTNISKRRERNRLFYSARPDLLSQKIESEKRKRRERENGLCSHYVSPFWWREVK